MAKFAVFFTFKGETVKGLMDKPSDRGAVVSSLCDAAGGRMEAYYLMFGAWDGFVIAEVPDSKAAAAISLAVSSSGAFGRVETHELLDSAELAGVLNTASGWLTPRPVGRPVEFSGTPRNAVPLICVRAGVFTRTLAHRRTEVTGRGQSNTHLARVSDASDG